MDAVVSNHDQDHHAPAVVHGELEEELVRERSNAEQEAAGQRTCGRRPPWRARRLVARLHPASVAHACARWLRHPAHVALVVWALCVAVSGGMLGLLLLGALDDAFPRRRLRNRWIEINNQVLNGLFTLMSIYQHPALFHHAMLLLRWRPRDTEELREAYCRKGTGGGGGGGHRRGERVHMFVVVLLLHITCFAQYAMCGLYWGYSRKARPDAAETTLTVVGTATPVIAGLYMFFSPLGRKNGPSVHQEPAESSVSDDNGGGAVEVIIATETAEWAGGLFDVGDDPTACWLSCLCTFCVFGWNMERLGLGNAYVHAVMFALLCFAPLWVLNVAAMNIRDEAVGDVVGAAGVALCALGLLYGGFWRARMRRRYGLHAGGGATACCRASPSLAGYVRWMFCWSCALAQEVRTANLLLDVEAGSVHRRHAGDGRADADGATLRTLPRENGVKPSCQTETGDFGQEMVVITDSHPVRLANCSPCRGDESPLLRQEEGSSCSSGEMNPPVPPSMPEGGRN